MSRVLLTKVRHFDPLRILWTKTLLLLLFILQLNFGFAQSGAALNFDGVNDIVTLSLILTSRDNITLEAKVKWNGNNGNKQMIVLNGNSGSNG